MPAAAVRRRRLRDATAGRRHPAPPHARRLGNGVQRLLLLLLIIIIILIIILIIIIFFFFFLVLYFVAVRCVQRWRRDADAAQELSDRALPADESLLAPGARPAAALRRPAPAPAAAPIPTRLTRQKKTKKNEKNEKKEPSVTKIRVCPVHRCQTCVHFLDQLIHHEEQ